MSRVLLLMIFYVLGRFTVTFHTTVKRERERERDVQTNRKRDRETENEREIPAVPMNF